MASAVVASTTVRCTTTLRPNVASLRANAAAALPLPLRSGRVSLSSSRAACVRGGAVGNLVQDRRRRGACLKAVAIDGEEEVVFSAESDAESVGGVKNGKHYEICYLISPDNTPDGIQEIIENYRGFVEDAGGAIHRLEDWGRRPLAYSINGKLDANYVLMNFEVDPKALKDFNLRLNGDAQVIRFMVFKRKEAITGPSPMLGGLV